MKFNKIKAAMFGSAVLALTVSASSQAALTLMANGDFENGGADWDIFEANPGDASFQATGGNPDGYGLAGGTSWGGGFVQCQGGPCALADFGLAGGDTTTFQYDMIDFDGNNIGQTGIKLESWTATAVINDTGDLISNGTTSWQTFSETYTFDVSATHFKAVLVGTNMGGGTVGFDNLMIDAGTVIPVPAAAWLFGSALAGLVAVRRKK